MLPQTGAELGPSVAEAREGDGVVGKSLGHAVLSTPPSLCQSQVCKLVSADNGCEMTTQDPQHRLNK